MPKSRLPSASEYAALGGALKELRRNVGLTQVQAAEMIDVRSTFISLVERGERGMRWHTLLALLRAYDADLHALAEAIERQGR